jgi:hypothetical protein
MLGCRGLSLRAGAYTDLRTTLKILRCVGVAKGVKAAEMKRVVPWIVVGSAFLALANLTGTATGASHRAQAAAVTVTQTCKPPRVQPHGRVDITAAVANTGDVPFTQINIDGDAGTPDITTDDFIPTYVSGDNGPGPPTGTLDPGETWIYTGSYNALAEDTVNNIGVDAFGGGTAVSDIDPCATDVVEPPLPGIRARVDIVRGKVLVKRPDSTKFVPLTSVTEIPIGSQINTINGTIRITTGLGGLKTNTADFYAGIFTMLQAKRANAVTTMRLDLGNFGICRKGGRALALGNAAAKSKKPVRRLWGSGKGRFATKGRYSSATVRGTIWLTQDQCNGTLVSVRQGIVQVRDFRGHKTVNVRPGHSYLAKAPGG